VADALITEDCKLLR